MLTILMATYNGEKYLKEQIDSLLNQTFTDFTLYIQDDVSTDGTWGILTNYQQKYPDKIKIVQNEINSGSAKNNFLNLMTTIKDDYLMLCDQDDVWLPDKIKITMAKMKEMEQNYPNKPIVVHTDLKVVDRNLNVIHPSYKTAANRNYNKNTYPHIVTLNNVSGCTSLYNRSLADLLSKKPDYTVMHDWWLQLVAASFGKVGHVNEPTILYRQHEDNSSGAKDVRSIKYKLKCLLNSDEVRKSIHSTFPQAKCFLESYVDILSHEQINFLQAYCKIPSMGKFGRIKTIFVLGAYMNGISRNIAYLMFV